jgi:hypothetical protein
MNFSCDITDERVGWLTRICGTLPTDNFFGNVIAGVNRGAVFSLYGQDDSRGIDPSLVRGRKIFLS